MSERLEPKLLAIIDRAADRIRKQDREAFRKLVFDILRGQIEPTATTVRHACGEGFLRYGRRI
jgi:hypothetical protein